MEPLSNSSQLLAYIEFLLARYSRAPPDKRHMLCEIGARVSCEQRGNLWEIITQLHKANQTLRLKLSGSLQAVEHL